MKKNYSILVFALAAIFLFSGKLYAQVHEHVDKRTCVAHEKFLELYQKSEKFRKKIDALEEFSSFYERTNFKATETRTIPVYVHVIYQTSQQNISDAQIQSQITVLNTDYGGTNPDLANVPSEFTSVTSNNTGIQYVLAGIDRKYVNRTTWGYNDAMKDPSQDGVAPITPDTHLNIWVCNIGSGILGYAQFPGGDPSTDGVVFSPQYCGSSDYDDGTFYLDAPFDKGRTATHEIGHYLNLRHIWGDDNGACSGTDYVDDTPNSASEYYGCPSYPQTTCSSSDMFMNYMDYVDDQCMFMFSQGQEARMWACLNSTRANLGTPGGNIAPVANANGPYSGDANVAINFSSAGSADADGTIVGYAWNFGDGGTSTSANPSHTYSSDGSYTVTLTVTDDEGATGTATTTASIGCAGVAACDGNLTLNLVTDRYASETSWDVRDASGNIIQQGSGYSNSTTYNIAITLAEGSYTFNIYDSYGDGICCGYGNGSYTLSDGCSNVLATGGNFESSESTALCIPTGGTPVNQPPVAEANGPYTVQEGTSLTFSSAGSTDSDGTIVSYLWNFGDGSSSTAANPSHTYTSDGTYTVTLTVTDDDGATDTDNTTATVTPSGGGGEVILSESYFESGWDGWIDGGSDCARYSGSRSYEGNYSIQIRDNSGAASSMRKTGLNAAGYDQLVIDFYFYAYSMESGEDFYVGFYNGSSWQIIADYVSGSSFSNGNFYHGQITLNSADYNFTSNAGVAFQCDASNDNDLIYIDAVTITAISSGARISGSTITKVDGIANAKISKAWNEDLKAFPNPVIDVLTIEYPVEKNTKGGIYTINGALVKSFELITEKTEVSVSDLKSGTYVLKINNKEEALEHSVKFLKQ